MKSQTYPWIPQTDIPYESYIPVQVNAQLVNRPLASVIKKFSDFVVKRRKPYSEVGVRAEEQETEGRP